MRSVTPWMFIHFLIYVQMELDIAFFAKIVGEDAIAEDFLTASHTRKKAFNSVFWNENMGQWVDYWLNYGAEPKVCLCPKDQKYRSFER